VHAPRLKKALGQHHLVSGALCRPLIEFLEPAGRRVVEVGPGGGVLTTELLAAGARVIAWELDLEWAAELRRRFGQPQSSPSISPSSPSPSSPSLLPSPSPPSLLPSTASLQVVAGDALDLPWGRLPAPALVAGNLPYNVATALLASLLPHHRVVPRAAFLVQREVAERLLAAPGDAAYGSFSVLAAAYARVVPLGRVRRGSFNPPPKVEGAFVGFELQAPPLPDAEMPAFLATVRLAFAQRRKTLRNALAAGWGRERTAAVLASLGLPANQRAESLDLAALLALHARSRVLAAGF
jgi:16S rRNA (adenine1518-N6/adenine1519-N6)-dimethyltransferase